MRFNYKILLLMPLLVISSLFVHAVSAKNDTIVSFNGYKRFDSDILDPLAQEALTKDIAEYALAIDVSFEEATQRLSLQDAIGNLEAQLATNEQSTYAGLWVQHQPDYRIIVQFTSDKEKTISSYTTGNLLTPFIKTRTVPISLEQLITTQTETLLIMEQLGIHAESGLNISENMVELYVMKQDEINKVLNRTNLRLPSFVQIIEVDKLSTETADIFAGLPLSTCTSSFSVQNSSGTKGITTAGHCNSSQSYNGNSLPFQGSAYGGQYEFQWHTAPNFTVTNRAYDGSINRPIYRTKHRNNQFIGEWVCAYGQVSGYRCGQISDKNFQPNPLTCPNCFTSTFIRVHRDGIALGGIGGDSGGPWMYGNTAYGIHHGRVNSNGDGIYMAINYISYLGLTVLTN